MILVKVENEIIVNIIDTDSPQNFPEYISGNEKMRKGTNINCYDVNGNLKDTITLVKYKMKTLKTSDGSDNIPEGVILEKIENNKIVPKTLYDLVKEGVVSLTPYEYLDDINKEVMKGTLEDSLKYKSINKKEYNEFKANEVRYERFVMLQKLDEIVMNPLRFRSLTEEQTNTLIEYRELLLDITKQKGFPSKVKWPEVPKFIK